MGQTTQLNEDRMVVITRLSYAIAECIRLFTISEPVSGIELLAAIKIATDERINQKS